MQSSFLLLCLTASLDAFTIQSLIGQSQVSHSGPNISGAPRGDPSDRIRSRRRRAYYFSNQYPSMLVESQPPDEWTRKWIVYEHNRFRRMVPASDMHMLYWSDELARSAQRHADRCDFRHSRDRVNVGENIWAAPYSNYSDAISIWFDEVRNGLPSSPLVNDPRCGCNHAYKHCCGHYVQVVWAKTNLVGCGFSRCRDVWGVQGRGHRNVFVCHYNPQGNTVFVKNNGGLYSDKNRFTRMQMNYVPAFTWASGEKGRCSDCPEEAPACYQGLCYKPSPDDPFWRRRN
ncbi:lon-1 [Pristionchus pacificus]|uniref:Lon-1 n=1 Tax=Pristionchus pacificus TaxID=54126 RepID=A0A2A6B467_PRIPA|nr:lon-1 [Pristionchus pacificus]|eukprot:PDM60658.1 lon-1 [Pristionchus pacificus]